MLGTLRAILAAFTATANETFIKVCHNHDFLGSKGRREKVDRITARRCSTMHS